MVPRPLVWSRVLGDGGVAAKGQDGDMPARVPCGHRARRRNVNTPKNAIEWQEAVDAAYFGLLLDSARQYGLVTGVPEINIERAEELLREGRQRGFVPHKDDPRSRW